MSQTTKRPAEDAFGGGHDADPNKTLNKKRRTRRRTDHGGHNDAIAATPTKHRQAVNSLARSTQSFESAQVGTLASESKHDTIKATSAITHQEQLDEKVLTVSDKKRRDKRAEKKLSKTKFAKHNRSVDSSAWSVSVASGGIFIEHDPIFTPDKQHIIVPVKTNVNVYSLSTSLLVRSIHIKDTDCICSCCISRSNPQRVLVATRKGLIVEHDWTTGSRISKWQTSSGLVSVNAAEESKASRRFFAISSVDGRDDEFLSLSVHSDQKDAQTQTLLSDSKLHKDIAVSADASHVVVCSNTTVHIGTSKIGSTKNAQDVSYTWYGLPVAGPISSFDVHFGSAQSRSGKKEVPVDVVVGHENGSIYVYEDILSRLVQQAKGGQAINHFGRELHWHRGLVRSVKWSRDRNYLISGGDESVLVLWQLETNQRQYLPHLSTAILNIAVSIPGSDYALRLGDNSVMVLSTADLAPSANITGLSLPNNRQDEAPILIHPTFPSRLIAAIPVRSIGGSKVTSNAITHLQTYDVDTNLQLSRQALTRNLTTAVNVAPNGQPLQEPSVTQMGISSDGQWLATVDKWSPNVLDTAAMYLNEDDDLARQQLTETVLRFWSWNAEESVWELANRINEPHTASNFSVLALASNPVTTEFSTIAEDGTVKIWRPKRRMRDGLQVQNKAGSALFNWNCAHVLHIEKSQIDADLASQPQGALAYSEDGSVLAASLSSKQRYVHLVDPRNGVLCASLPNLVAEGQASLVISGRSLVCLSKDFRIFDMITLQSTFTMSLPKYHGSFLVKNARVNSVAIGLNLEERHASSTVTVIGLEDPDQDSKNSIDVSGEIRAILPEPFGQDFVIIDNECRTRKLIPPRSAAASTSSALIHPVVATEDERQMKTFEDLFGRDQERTRTDGTGQQQQQKMIEDAGPSRGLSDLFSANAASASGQLGINELFERVSRAVAGSRTQAQVVA